MTTHDRDKIIAAAKEAGFQVIFDGKFGRDDYFSSMASIPSVERFYAIAFEAGRQAERVITIEDDDNLRFINRVLESNNPAEADKATCLMLIHEIRSKARSTK